MKWPEKLIIIGVYVNDLILGSKCQEVLELLKDQLMKDISIKDLKKAKISIR